MINGSVVFFTGNCHTTDVVTTISHVIINILSTILLAYSNFGIQCLTSPTRKEVERAHSRKNWLSIGTPNIRNLFFISKRKVCLIMLLIASSFPLHMVWNAVIFETQTTNDYLAVVAAENFTRGADWSIPKNANATQRLLYRGVIGDLQYKVQKNALEELDPRTCYDAYNKDLLMNRRNVIAVVNTSIPGADIGAIDRNSWYNGNGSSIMTVYEYQFTSTASKGIHWKSRNQVWIDEIKYYPGQVPISLHLISLDLIKCYSEPVKEQCKISLIPAFLAAVIACNIIKAGCCLLALLITQMDPPLVTTGDAIQSFLKDPDTYTRGRCLVAKKDYDTYKNLLPSKSPEWNSRPATTGDTWTGGRDRWLQAVSVWQWTILVLLWLAMVLTGFLASKYGYSGNFQLQLGLLWSVFAYGSRSATKLPENSRFIASFLLINLPQLAVSYIYIGLNNILTTMLAMSEWCGYSSESKKPAKGLRVSSPVANTEQRGTYFLSLPYKWSIPATVVITTIHWLVSEILIIVQIDVNKIGTRKPSQTVSLNYYYTGTNPLLLAVGLGTGVVVAFLCLASWMKYPTAMPLAGCCSASIAAACQPSGPLEDDSNSGSEFPRDLALQKLKWGVVLYPEEGRHGIGHATFTAGEVAPLEEEQMYA